MTQAFATDPVMGPEPGRISEQKFGRIDDVRTMEGRTEIDVRQPDSGILTVSLTPESIDGAAVDPVIGRNVWLSGWIEGVTMTASIFMVYPEEP